MPEGPIATIIREKLTTGLSPDRLVIVDDSARHAGHHHEGGMDGQPGGESHFNLTVVAAAFEGQGRVQRQRAINALLRWYRTGADMGAMLPLLVVCVKQNADYRECAGHA